MKASGGDDEQVIAALRAYLEALGRNEDPSPRAGGDLAVVMRLGSEVTRRVAIEDSRVDIRQLRVESVRDDEVRVAFEGVFSYTEPGPHRIVVPLSGPVILKREGLEWKVMDYVANGMSTAGAKFGDAKGRVTLGHVALQAQAADLLSPNTAIFVKATNSGDSAIELRRPIIRPSLIPYPGRWWPSPVVSPRSTLTMMLMWGIRTPLDRSSARIWLRARESATGDRYAGVLEVEWSKSGTGPRLPPARPGCSE